MALEYVVIYFKEKLNSPITPYTNITPTGIKFKYKL